MEDTLNVPLTPELRAAIDQLTEAEGLSPEGLMQRALQEFVFVHQFRSLREQLLKKAQADYTDDDIFEMTVMSRAERKNPPWQL
jgi:predicted transcriptional regulator